MCPNMSSHTPQSSIPPLPNIKVAVMCFIAVSFNLLGLIGVLVLPLSHSAPDSTAGAIPEVPANLSPTGRQDGHESKQQIEGESSAGAIKYTSMQLATVKETCCRLDGLIDVGRSAVIS